MTPSPDDDDRTVLRSGSTGAAGAGNEPTRAAHDTPTRAASAESPPPAAASRDGNALEPGTVLGEFELRSVLGVGGFGIVYVAWDRSLQRKVAIKEYMPSSLAERGAATDVRLRSERHRETFELGLRSFINEARLLAQFDHPSLLKVYRFWEANGTAYMAMPLYEGRTLKQTLAQMDAAPDEAWLMQMLAPLTEALAVLHAQNCFHRDIAPDNVILLAGSGRPLLLDFGAARRVIGDVTHALTVILKPGYAPVEQYAEAPEMQQGAWTDVYALAATVHYAVTGRTPPASVSRMITDGYQPLASVAAGRYSERFLAAIDRALKVRPDERTPSIAALREDLGLPPADTSGTPAPSVTVAAPASPAHRAPAAAAPSRRGVVVGAAAVAGLAVVGAGAWLVGGRGGAPQPAPPAAAVPAPTPAVAPPPAERPPPTPRFEVREQFERVLAAQTPGFEVRAAPAKPVFRIGRDRLQFEVASSRDGFVQVLVLGPDGSLILMFPNAQASNNRIRAGQTLALPQPSWPLDVTEPAGREEFLVIVSDQPRDYSELSRDTEYIFRKLPTGAAGAQALAGWTRSTPLLLGAIRACPSADCEAYGAAAFGVDIVP